MTKPNKMTEPGRTFVIVGAGLAGAKAAETVREEEGFTGRVVLVCQEPAPPSRSQAGCRTSSPRRGSAR
jgi:3-phenylpropionate/trans-cinnamate dioxygenase ferredoxin reductase subunit